MKRSDKQRFEAKVDKAPGFGPNKDCWKWAASLTPKGYGWFRMGGRMTSAHRAAFALYRGPITDGMYVCHKCDNPSCVNPAHLFLGTHQDNMQDMTTKGRGLFQKRTHCPNGHPYDDATMTASSRGRRCLICVAGWKLRRKEAKAAIRLSMAQQAVATVVLEKHGDAAGEAYLKWDGPLPVPAIDEMLAGFVIPDNVGRRIRLTIEIIPLPL